MSAPRDQHFLTDQRIASRIAGFAAVEGRRVLEIGPGRGALTRELLRQGATVTAMELDPALVEILRNLFAAEIQDGRFEVVRGDAVRDPLPEYEIVVSNLPYSASSRIIFRLIREGFEEAVLMVQKEFARRMAAPPGTHGCGRLSVMVQTYARVRPLLEVGPSAFTPRPKVRSWVVRLTPHEPPHPITDHRLYADLVRLLFSNRRKMVRTALRGCTGIFGGERIEAVLAALPEEILVSRPEQLELRDFARIASVLAEDG
ncbi:MAG: 16S rRNA (adenine(1518)-N(6)/adenine(1519)-N(6))-dimethyltransferase RsmA [Methanoculleaceae archaeon]